MLDVSSLHDHPYQRAGVLFAPHGSSEDMLLVDKFPAIAATNSEEQHSLHTVFTLGQLEEIMLPEAIDYFCQHEKAAVYQMLWRSRHGTAYIQVAAPSSVGRRKSACRRPRRRHPFPPQAQALSRSRGTVDLLPSPHLTVQSPQPVFPLVPIAAGAE